MDSRFSWHRRSFCFLAITIVVMLVAIFPGYAEAQEAPSAGSPQLHFSDLKLGIFRGAAR